MTTSKPRDGVMGSACLEKATQPRRFIKLAKVKEYTSLSTSEIYRRIAAGTFPKQVKLGPKSSCFVEAEILAWCDEMAAKRGEAA